MSCETVRTTLLEGSAAERNEVADHLVGCPACSALSERIEDLEGELWAHRTPELDPMWDRAVAEVDGRSSLHGWVTGALIALAAAAVLWLAVPRADPQAPAAPPPWDREVCGDLVRLEPPAMMGRLDAAQVRCLEARGAVAAPEGDASLRVLLAHAHAVGAFEPFDRYAEEHHRLHGPQAPVPWAAAVRAWEAGELERAAVWVQRAAQPDDATRLPADWVAGHALLRAALAGGPTAELEAGLEDDAWRPVIPFFRGDLGVPGPAQRAPVVEDRTAPGPLSVVVVSGDHVGHELLVDGVAVDTLPARLELEPGRHVFRVVQPDGPSFEVEREVWAVVGKSHVLVRLDE